MSTVSWFRQENYRGQKDRGRAQIHSAAARLTSDGETLENDNGSIFSILHLEFFPEYNF